MARSTAFTLEDRIGIGAAIAAHLVLLIVLTMRLGFDRAPLAPPERINVSLATDISLESTAPDPSAEPAAAAAAPAEPVEVAEPQPVVTSAPVERPVERTVPTPPRRTTERSTPTPTPRPSPSAAPSRRPTRDLARELDLPSQSDATGDSGSPADRPSAQQQASIDSEIVRQLRPHWSPPSGIDVDRLVTVVRFRLNRDGTLRGNPEVLATNGVNESNRAQVARHQEQAVRAVRLAAPFNLPERFYSGWSVVTSNFDNRLAQ